MNQMVTTQRLSWRSAGFTHAGNVRSDNQDAWLSRPEIGLWAVADGMGGHTDGEFASQAIIDALNREFRATGLEQLQEQVRRSLFDVNRRLCDRAAERANGDCIGSTLVAALIQGDRCSCLWVGDSRLYLLRNHQLYQVTRDHTLAQQWLDAGQDPAQINRNSQRHALTRALGAAPTLRLDARTFRVAAGDRLLLCSDGLYRELDLEEISILLNLGNPLEVAHTLQSQVLRRRARDNLTGVVVQIERN